MIRVSGKIIIGIAGKPFEYFGADSTIKDIFNFISHNIDTAEDIPFVDIDLLFDDVPLDNKEEVAESIEETGKKNIDLIYHVPKSLAFTQRFQDRIRHDIPNIIESVYNDCKVVGIYWLDEDTSMKLTISVEFANENFMKYSKYLDENVGFAVDDIVRYYTER